MATSKGMRAAALAAALGILAAGCASNGEPTNAAGGAAFGALAGGMIGGAMGRHNGHAAKGGFAGAALGAVIGGLAGAVSDARREGTAPRSRDAWDPNDPLPAGGGEFLPPVPPPARVVRRTTIVRTVPCRPVIVERRVYVIDD